MPRSTLTVAELKATAILLGEEWWYDPYDHTFNLNEGIMLPLDADTMEQIPNHTQGRRTLVTAGQLGASNYEEHRDRIESRTHT